MAVIYSASETFALGSGNVKLSVIVGNKQKANTMVLLGDDMIVWGMFTEITVGSHAACIGKELFIEVNATDTNSKTDTIPVTIVLKDDVNEKTFEYENDADRNGGTVIFDITIKLK